MNTDLSSSWQRGIATLGLAALCIGIHPLAASGQTPKYSVTKLGTLVSSSENDWVAAMSADGSKIVGTAQYVQGNKSGTNAFYWDGAMHTVDVMQPLGGLGGTPGTTPISVNSSGMVLLGISPASVWTLAGGTVPLPAPGGQQVSQNAAYAMNEAGVVAGMSDNPNVPLGTAGGSPIYAKIALRWSKDMAGQWAYAQLPPLAGHNYSRTGFGASALDQGGNVIGCSCIASLDANGNVVQTDVHAVLWDSGLAAHDLGAQTQGFVPTDSRTDAFLQTRFVWNLGSHAYYSDATGTTELLGSGAASPSAAAKGVNVLGQVAGVASFAGGSHASYWDTSFPSGAVIDLGVLPGMSSSTLWHTGQPVNVIDDSGFMVGTSSGSTDRAFLSTPASRATTSKLLDLNALLTTNALKSAGITTLTQGRIINNAGFIACHGTDSKAGSQRVVLLTRVQ